MCTSKSIPSRLTTRNSFFRLRNRLKQLTEVLSLTNLHQPVKPCKHCNLLNHFNYSMFPVVCGNEHSRCKTNQSLERRRSVDQAQLYEISNRKRIFTESHGRTPPSERTSYCTSQKKKSTAY
uniref:Uncharacterized protein n=1 Tax=Opuntia streptacantha TaxID=393608 RepID=A0A7C9AA89_OPUST